MTKNMKNIIMDYMEWLDGEKDCRLHVYREKVERYVPLYDSEIEHTVLEFLSEYPFEIEYSTNGFSFQNGLAGFDLAGNLHPSGSIELLPSGKWIAHWPEEITVNKDTFTLENVIKGQTNPETGVQYQCAAYA